MREVALVVTRSGVGLLKQLDCRRLEQAVNNAGWKLTLRTEVLGTSRKLESTVYRDLEQLHWTSLDDAREPRAEIAVLGSMEEVNGRYPNDLSVVYKVPTDLSWFWASPHYMEAKRDRLTLSWEPPFPEEPHDHGWFDQSYDVSHIYDFVKAWLRNVSARMRLRVFISYARQDSQVARQLFDQLTISGHEPWLDERSLLAGQDWQLEIRRAVRAADAIVLLVSKRSAGKVGYVQKEIRLAIDAAEMRPEGSIFVVPVLLDDANIPDSLSQWNYLDASRADWFHELVRSLDHVRRNH